MSLVDNLIQDCTLAKNDQNIFAITTKKLMAKEAVYNPCCYEK